jgi:hypothetical protein
MVQVDTDDTSDNVTRFPGAEPQRPKDPTGAERQARFRQNHKRNGRKKGKRNNQKRGERAPTVTPDVAPIVTPAPVLADAPPIAPTVTQSDRVEGVTPPRETRPRRRHDAAVDVAAYVVAVGLAGAAAFFSIRGMVVIFPGSPVPVVIMAIAMESAKLVTAGWLARRWTTTAGIWRAALVVFIFGLAVINATGVYAQLVSAHVGERGEATYRLEERTADLEARIDVQAHKVADLDRRLGQIDTAIEESAKRGRTKSALSAIESQRKIRGELADERNREAGVLAALKAERASVAAQGRRIETEATPIRYVAELVGADTDSERAIRWLIALMVICCDPLAIALTAVASARRSTIV